MSSATEKFKNKNLLEPTPLPREPSPSSTFSPFLLLLLSKY